jgi:hypothetical protein
MAIKWIKGEKAGSIEFEGKTLSNSLERYLGFDRYRDYALVWTGTSVVEITIGDGYCSLTNTLAHAEKDATEETLEQVRQWEKAKAESARQVREKREREKEAKTIRKGKRVRVIKGRKIEKGTEGEVFWTGKNKYNPSEIRLGFKDSKGETFWTSEKNVEVIIN